MCYTQIGIKYFKGLLQSFHMTTSLRVTQFRHLLLENTKSILDVQRIDKITKGLVLPLTPGNLFHIMLHLPDM